MSDFVVREFTKNLPEGRAHAVTLHVVTDNGECASTIPNPRAYSDEGGPEWVMRYGDPEAHRYEIASLIGSFEYLLSPDYTASDAIERLRTLRRAYREALAAKNPTQ